MSYYDIFYPQFAGSKEPPPEIFSKRSETLEALVNRPVCDVLVVGGGIHGAAFANLAAFNGLNIVLLEQGDYACETSSRSSKMAHGGLRYLEMFDFAQVFEGIKCRDDLFQIADHLVKPWSFLIPVAREQLLLRWKLKIGLWIYDLFLKDRSHRHAWRSDISKLPLASQANRLKGCFNYTDGIMDDARLVMEHILAARQEGARCLNYARANSLKHLDSGGVKVGWQDVQSGQTHELLAGIVVNCTGPWVGELGRVKTGPLSNQLAFSKGSHILFNQPYSGEALFMPMAEKGRYYFVWPHPAGTLVGTTERPVAQPEKDPLPEGSEIEEIFQRVEKDLSFLGLTREQAHYCYAGLRTLPLRSGSSNDLSQVSRKHIWTYANGVLSLLGGKFTTARATVFDGFKQLYKLTDVLNKPTPLTGRKLPGGGLSAQEAENFRRAAREAAVPEVIVEQTLARRGKLIRFFAFCHEPFKVLGNVVLQGDVELAIRMEQATNLEDILRRRCGLEYFKDHGIAALPEIIEVARRCLGEDTNFYDQAVVYRKRMQDIADLLQKRV